MNIHKFRILRNTYEVIELKSKYHYWRMVRIYDSQLFVLSHKYNLEDEYHKQKIQNHSYTACLKYIDNHDKYFETLGK